jgi:hypothetical protein
VGAIRWLHYLHDTTLAGGVNCADYGQIGLYEEYGVDGLKEAEDHEVMKWLRLCKNDGKAAVLKRTAK